jgi:lipopolysaccharide transport system ATP-binding protein
VDWSALARKLRLQPGQASRRPPREVWALKDVSFALQSGTVLGVIGPNGAGKTTLLKVIGRVTLPTEGRVRGRGRVVSLLELGAGFQPDLPARENVVLNAAMQGISRAEALRRFDGIVEFAELGEFVDLPVKRYSSGMYLRLAFSVAINMDPDILLADEVLAVGDLVFQERCIQRVRAAGSAGLTVLFVSHDMAAIRRVSDRVIWLDRGHVVEDGDPEEVVAHYERAAWARMKGARYRGKNRSHVNEHAEILSTRLLSAEHSELGAARVAEECLISIMFRLRTPGVHVRCAVDVYARTIHAFRSVQAEPVQLAKTGVYTANLRIPAHLLADTLYTTNVSVTVIRDDAEHPVVDHESLSFRVYDTDERNLPHRRGDHARLAGALAPRLDWEVVREKSLAKV